MTGEREADVEFGGLVSEHGAGWRTRVAVYVLIVVGGGLVIASDQGLAVFVLAVAVLTVAILEFVLTGQRVRLFAEGIEAKGRFSTKRLAWRELQSYQLQILDKAALLAVSGGLVGLLVASGLQKLSKQEQRPSVLTLVGKNGNKVVLSMSLRRYCELLEALLPPLTERLFYSTKLAFEQGAQVQFGKKLALQQGVGITFTGMFGKQYTLPLEGLASARFERAAFVIRKADGKIWQRLRPADLLNPGVLQRLVEAGQSQVVEGMPLAWASS